MQTTKLMTLAVLATSLIASSAFAGSNTAHQRMGERNAAYFQSMGAKDSGQAVAQNPDYNFANNPQQRMAKRSDEYWAKVGYSKGEAAPASGVSQYPFPGSRLDAERGGYVYSPAAKH